MTYRQAVERHADLRKGEKSSLVVYAKTVHGTRKSKKNDPRLRAGKAI
jgi:antirestriction protein ArdC